ADAALIIADLSDGAACTSVEPGPVEQLARSLLRDARMRLLLARPRGMPIQQTRRWLDARPGPATHHHAIIDERADYDRLARFLLDRARGLAACGGGAFSCAHIGVLEACEEAGLVFDLIGGTSGGAAMTGAFALGIKGDELERRTHDIFVR